MPKDHNDYNTDKRERGEERSELADGMRIGMLGLVTASAPLYAEALSEIDDVSLVAVCTMGRDERYIHEALAGVDPQRYPKTAPGFSERFGPTVYDDVEPFFDEGSLDAVVLCSEDLLRAGYVARALARGIHVFVPAPFASSLEEAMILFRASREGRAFLTPGLPLRHHPVYQAARDALDAGRLGEVLSTHVAVCQRLDLGCWHSDPTLSAGPEFVAGLDALDVLGSCFDDGPSSLFAMGGNIHHRGSPFIDSAKVVVRFNRGGLGSADILLSPRYRFPSLELTIVGSDGGLRIERRGDRGGMALRFYDREGESDQLVAPSSVHRTEMLHWLEVLQAHDQQANDLWYQQGVMALQLCIALKQSWHSQQPVALPLPLPQAPTPPTPNQDEESTSLDDADDTIL